MQMSVAERASRRPTKNTAITQPIPANQQLGDWRHFEVITWLVLALFRSNQVLRWTNHKEHIGRSDVTLSFGPNMISILWGNAVILW